MADYYTVKAGDSWAKIAGQLYGGDQRMFGELQRANKGVLMLKAGMKIAVPKKVDNPFVSFAQATQGSAYDEQKFADTQAYIAKLQGGADWQAKAGLAGQVPAKTAPPNVSMAGLAGNPQQMAQAQFAQNALNQRMSSNAPAARAAQENASPNRPYQNPVTGEMQTWRQRWDEKQGQGTRTPDVAGSRRGGANAGSQNPNWLTTPMNQQAWGQSLLNLPGQIGGAISNFAQGVSAGAQTSVAKTAEAGRYNVNATPFEKLIAGTQQTQPQPQGQPVTAGPKVPQTKPTGANNIKAKLPADEIARSYEAHQAATFIFEMDETVLEQQYKYGLSHQAAVDAYMISGFSDPTAAEKQATMDLMKAGWTRSGSEWLPPQKGTELPTLTNASTTNLSRLDWQNMDISTLTQLGFYDAPSQPTYGTTGRETSGGAAPAPVISLRGSGQSWNIRP